nr:hypothetical protein [Tanacetum cinerariifolium]
TFKYWGVLRILMISLRLIPLSEHNVNFHLIVDFVEASPLRIETTEEGTKILATVDGILRTITESSLMRNLKLQDEEGISSLPDMELFENRTPMGYNISPNQKFTFQKDEPASPLRDISQGKACLTDSDFEADQDRATIAKTSTLPNDSAPRVTSPAAAEDSMKQTLNELTAFYTSPQRQHSELISKFEAQELEINRLKARVKLLEDREGVAAERSRDDAPIKGRQQLRDLMMIQKRWKSFIPTASPPADEVPTGSDVVPTAGLIFATATVVTPYTRRKGKETMVESKTPKKKKIQEQMDIQIGRLQLEEEMERDSQRMNEQIARDGEIARIYAEEELQSVIDRLDKSNEIVAKYLQEYHQFATELPLERRIKLISDLIKYQDNYAKLEDFIPMGSKKEAERLKRKGLNLKQESVKKLKTPEEVPEEAKSPDEVPKEKVKEMMQLVPIEEVYVEALQVKHPIIDWKHLDREDLNQLWALVKESLSNRPPTSDKKMELWIELKRLYEPDDEDQLWTHTQNWMHALVEWKLYDTCGVHHVTAKDKEIFMLMEMDYPLRKGLAIGMISYKLQVENYSKMANDLILKKYKIAVVQDSKGRIVGNKMHKAFPLPVIEFPLPEEVPTTIEESFH